MGQWYQLLFENIRNSKIYHVRNDFISTMSSNEWYLSHNHILKGDNDSIWGLKIYIITYTSNRTMKYY